MMHNIRQHIKRAVHKKNKALRVVVATGTILAVFVLGVTVGNGRIQASFMVHTKTENSGLPAQLDYSSVTAAYRILKQNYHGTLTTVQLLDGMKTGLAESTKDPYTEYFNPTQAKEFEAQLNNSFSGIGAELGKDDQGNLIVVSPIKGFPADKAGLKAQDIIAEIDGSSTSGMSPDIAVGKIRGPKGTTVTLKLIRDKSQTLSVTITRDDIQLPSVTTKTLPGNIGYIQISSFADDTSGLARQAAATFKQAKVSGLILDLRGNPGGLLSAAIDISSLWLQSGATIVTEKGTGGMQVSTAPGDNPLHGIPTVVLIDGGSASASEITAGALHDNGMARLMGEKSYGKGVVQQLINLGDGGELKVTVASWYRPNGESIQKKGITPDQTVPLSDADAKAGNDTQLKAAETYLGNL
jgi:carboxyl-terminal processing protease